jgi:uroporphyrinogen-III synthase
VCCLWEAYALTTVETRSDLLSEAIPGPGALVWVTRAQPDADQTAERLSQMGRGSWVWPLLTVQSIRADLDLAGVGTLAFTSANGVRCFAEQSSERNLLTFTVGDASAKVARELGFKKILSADGDVEALADRIASRRLELSGFLLHPSANEPAGDLVGALEARQIPARQVIVYATIESPGLSEALAGQSNLGAILVYSPRAAEILVRTLAPLKLTFLPCFCLSAKIGSILREAGFSQVRHSALPLEGALLGLLDR